MPIFFNYNIENLNEELILASIGRQTYSSRSARDALQLTDIQLE